MRILHTSDWHLGRTLFQTSLLDEQRRFLDWLLATAQGMSVSARFGRGLRGLPDIVRAALAPPRS